MDSLNWARLYMILAIPCLLLGVFDKSIWIFSLAILSAVASVFHSFVYVTDSHKKSIDKLEKKVKKLEKR